MTQDILDHLDDVLTNLKNVSSEIESSIKDDSMDPNISEELEFKIYEPLIELIDKFEEMIESINKSDDINWFNDPYGDELDN